MSTAVKSNLVSLPSIDPTLTAANIRPIMEGVGNWRQLKISLIIPDTIVERITKQHATDKMQSCAAGEWWVHTHPYPSWDSLTNALYHTGEERALERMAQYLPKGAYMERILYTVVLIVSVSSAISCSLLD